ncbi:DUF1420 family protein [Polynucleobacter paneuropaeus]|nr:DUF1420 family protein [Polynucleobacter paneuropaeus]
MPYLALNNVLIASLLILGFSQLGKIGIFCFKKLLKRQWPIQFTGQYLLLGFAISCPLISWLSLVLPSAIVYQTYAFLLVFLGMFCLANLIRWVYSAALISSNTFKEIQGLDLSIVLCFFIALLYFVANYGPVTNGDSLDYHLGYAYNFLKAPFESFPDWYNGRMAQSGEKLIAIGLSLNAESVSNLIQCSSLLAICFLINHVFQGNWLISKTQKNYLILAFISSPIFLFLAVSAKPQLMPIALTTLAFVMLMNLEKYENAEQDNHIISTLGVVVFLTAIAMSQKFSFYISGSIIFIFSALIAYKRKIFFQFFSITILILFIIVSPVFIDKFQRYQSNFLDLIFNPVAGSTDSLRLFMQWLKAYRENSLPFPLFLILPSKLGNVSTVLGVGTLIVFACLFIVRHIPKYVVLLYLLFILIIVSIGQPSSRFYVEAYIWALLIFAYFGQSIRNKLVLLLAAISIVFQSLLVIASLGIYDLNLVRAFVTNDVDGFQNRYAYGADLGRWLDTEFPDGSPVLYDHRSHAFTSRVLVSTFPIEFFGADEIDIEILRANLIRFNANKLLTYSGSPNFELLQACSMEKLAGPKEFMISTRNPFNSGLTYQAFVYKIDPNQLIECVIHKNKK